MRLYHGFLTIAMLAMVIIFATNAAGSAISMSAEISRSSLAFEEKDTLVVRLVWEGETALYQIGDFPLPALEKLKIMGSSSSVTSRRDTASLLETTVRTLQYFLEPTDYGTGVVGSLNLTVTNRATGEKQELKTGRLTVAIAKPKPYEESVSSMKMTWRVLLGAVIVFCGGVLYVFRRRSIRNRRVVGEASESPYLKSLEEIKKETVSDGKLFYSRLYRLLLQYLEKERVLKISGKTGEEILIEVMEMGDEEERTLLMSWLRRALEAKFRPDMPAPTEIEDIYNAVGKFLESKVTNK